MPRAVPFHSGLDQCNTWTAPLSTLLGGGGHGRGGGNCQWPDHFAQRFHLERFGKITFSGANGWCQRQPYFRHHDDSAVRSDVGYLYENGTGSRGTQQ
jgi:hypothetical protein